MKGSPPEPTATRGSRGAPDDMRCVVVGELVLQAKLSTNVYHLWPRMYALMMFVPLDKRTRLRVFVCASYPVSLYCTIVLNMRFLLGRRRARVCGGCPPLHPMLA